MSKGKIKAYEVKEGEIPSIIMAFTILNEGAWTTIWIGGRHFIVPWEEVSNSIPESFPRLYYYGGPFNFKHEDGKVSMYGGVSWGNRDEWEKDHHDSLMVATELEGDLVTFEEKTINDILEISPIPENLLDEAAIKLAKGAVADAESDLLQKQENLRALLAKEPDTGMVIHCANERSNTKD